MQYYTMTGQNYIRNSYYYFFWEIRLRVWAVTLRNIPLSRHLSFFIFLRNPSTRMCVSTVASFQLFGNTMKKYRDALVDSWFFGLPLKTISLYI